MSSVSLAWSDLRAWRGSQHAAFEEVCAQLATAELPSSGAIFVRKAAPDAGVECYWRLPSGDEWAWQAKFFTSMGESQWRQLDESVAKALEKHPRLVKLTICIPLGFADPRLDGKLSAMDQWNNHVAKWEGWAHERGRVVTFPYWGEHELANRLLQDQHRGRILYWFGKQRFSQEWFNHRLEEAIANADQRYLPQLNVDLAIQDIFRGLGRTPEFFDRLKVMQGKVCRAYHRLTRPSLDAVDSELARHLDTAVNALLQLLAQIDLHTILLPFEKIQKSTQEVARLAQRFEQRAWEKECPDEQAPSGLDQTRRLAAERYYLGALYGEARELGEFAGSYEATLANTPGLLLVGNAGTGKTHLLCHVARTCATQDLPTVLVLSEQLANGEPWNEIIRALQLTCDADELLGALNAAGQARGLRVLIAIDALNEGDAQTMWNRSLPGFLTRAARYPWVGVVVSVRKSYETTIIGNNLIATNLVRVEHRGFYGAEARAATHFFTHYGIVAPTIPPLHPEFSNPLFLRLFCQALQNLGHRQLPSGLQGLTRVFSFFLDSVNEKLARPAFLDVDPADRIVQKCVECLVEAMALQQRRWLPRTEAREIVSSCHQSQGYERSLFRYLVVEGVLAEDRFHTGVDDWADGVRFTYEKFSDHLIAQHLLDRQLNRADPRQSFAPGTPLGDLVRDEWARWQSRGIVEAFAIQLPETVGRELPEIVPEVAGFTDVREAMIESIVWRAPNSFADATRTYLNEWLLPYDDTFELTMSALVTTATQVDHPYNARVLHRNLVLRPLADRDAWWSIYLHHEYIGCDTNVITRLLDWCGIDQGKQHLSDESILLAAITMTWFFTSSNRFLRDRATKALVKLLSPRVKLLATLLHEFAGVDDPYVLERLAAVAYGCVMRSQDVDGIHAVAKATHDAFFVGEPPVHVLSRDYARGVIERAVHLRQGPLFDHARIAPPYGSSWPDKILTQVEIRSLGYDDRNGHPAYRSIYFSVMAGDFGRYIIGTNWSQFAWTNIRPRDTPPLSRQERTRKFVASLTDEQRKAWRRFRGVFREERKKSPTIPEILVMLRSAESAAESAQPSEIRRDRMETANMVFCATLLAEQQEAFKNVVLPFLESGERRFHEEHRFDLTLVQRYILQRVYELGWTSERFGYFDSRIGSMGREAHKAERIGKKYQWIAYHEVLARVADNFMFKGRSWSEQPVRFEGPWQANLRDIDPSMLLRKTAREQRHLSCSCWWSPPPYNDWYAIRSYADWVKAERDLPSLPGYLRVADPADGACWVVLEANYRWEEPTPPEKEWTELSHRTVWYRLQAYIVRKQDASEVFHWAKDQNFWGRWMPESGEFHELFLGELYWSPAYREEFAEMRGERAWTRGDLPNQVPKPLIVPTMMYGGMGTNRDCSMEDAVHMHVPSPWLAEHLGLRWAGVEGEFCGPDGKVAARDPSVTTPGPPALLVKEDVLRRFFDAEGYELIWTVLGCKEIIGEHHAVHYELQLNGAFVYRNGNIDGAVKGTLYPESGTHEQSSAGVVSVDVTSLQTDDDFNVRSGPQG